MVFAGAVWSDGGKRVAILTPLLLLILMAQPAAPSAQAQLTMTVSLNDFSFEPSTILAQPGEEATLFLVNNGLVDHTFTLFAEPNANVPLDNNEALQNYYQQAEVIVDIRISPGESAWANFTAPTTEANYILVCIIPGHAILGMHGVFRVGGPAGPGPGLDLQIGIVQALMLVTLAGTVVFAVVYHLRSRRAGE